MSPLLAFFIGLLVTLLILVPFYVLSMRVATVSNVWITAFCKQAVTF